MKNITVSLDDETYRRARTIAAQRNTSVSALVKRFLIDLASEESETERLKPGERAFRERIVDFDALTGCPATTCSAAALEMSHGRDVDGITIVSPFR